MPAMYLNRCFDCEQGSCGLREDTKLRHEKSWDSSGGIQGSVQLLVREIMANKSWGRHVYTPGSEPHLAGAAQMVEKCFLPNVA